MAEYLDRPIPGRAFEGDEGDFARNASGVSWGAIFAGALGAAALSLVLLLLGTGLGFSSISPWTNRGASATAIGIATVLWLTFTQLAASGMGGYLAGRLRTKWVGVHTDEVYFRDTAHGFLAWAVATLLTAAVLGGAVSSVIGTTAQVGASVVGGAATTAMTAGAGAAAAGASNSAASSDSAGPMNYFVDSLFRRDMTATGNTSATATDSANTTSQVQTPFNSSNNNAEVARVFVNSLRTGTLPPDDAKYVGQLVAQRTGLSQADAEKRVNDTFAKTKAAIDEAQTKAKEAADTARKTSAYAALWLVVSLLVGAFVAAFAGTLGGRRRDL